MIERLHLAKNRIDIIVAVLGVCGGLASLYFYTLKLANAYLLMLGIIFTFTSIAYLLLRKKLVYSAELNIQPGRHPNLVLNIIFVLLFTGSIYALHTNVFRPPIYFILISLCSSILAVEVLLYNPRKKYQLYILLFEICLVAFNLRAGIYLNYSGMIGVDPWTLRLFVEDIINNGAVVESKFLGQYSSFVIMQIYSAIASLICGVSSKLGMFMAVILPNIICSIFIFLIARKLLSEKIGLIAMLIYGLCDFSIAYSVHICAWSFGIALYIILLYLLLVDKKAINKYRSYFIFLFFALLILTHPVPAVILVIPLIILFVYTKLWKSINVVSHTLVISYIVATLSYWLYASYTISANVKRSFFDTIVGPLYHSLTTHAAVLHRTETTELMTGGPNLFFESILNILGFSLLVLFGLVGGLILLSDKRRDPLKLSLITITFVILAFPFAFGFFGIRNIMNYRWFVYGYVTLAILAAIGLTTIIGQRRSTNKKIITAFLIIFVLSFFMTTNTVCNHDSPLYFKDGARRFAFTEQELSLRNELINTYSGPITTDWNYYAALTSDEPYPDPKDIKFCYSTTYSYEDFCNDVLPQSLFIWREYYKDRPRIIISSSKGSMLVVFGENFKEKLESNAYNKIYSNEQVSAYLYTETL